MNKKLLLTLALLISTQALFCSEDEGLSLDSRLHGYLSEGFQEEDLDSAYGPILDQAFDLQPQLEIKGAISSKDRPCPPLITEKEEKELQGLIDKYANIIPFLNTKLDYHFARLHELNLLEQLKLLRRLDRMPSLEADEDDE